MSLRTIDAPGVEIKEIDKSGYTPAMTGTKCFVMGYSDKGEPYAPMEFTSKAAWQLYYGDPDNEAERYFYNACTEVINQNGVLYCARLPYDNKAFEKMNAFKYNVDVLETKPIYTAGEYLAEKVSISSINHNKHFETDAFKYIIDNKFYRIKNDGETIYDWELCSFFTKVLDHNADESLSGNLLQYKMHWYQKNPEKSGVLSVVISQGEAEAISAYLNKYNDTDYSDRGFKYHNISAYDVNGDWCVSADRYEYAEQFLYDIDQTGTDFDVYSEIALTSMDVPVIHGKVSHLSTYLAEIRTRDGVISDSVSAIENGWDTEYLFGMDISAINDLFTNLGYSDISVIYNTLLSDFKEKGVCILNLTPCIDCKYASSYDIYDDFKRNGGIGWKDIINTYKLDYEQVMNDAKYREIREADPAMDKYIEITHAAEPYSIDLTAVDEYRTGESKVQNGTFVIVDKTCGTLNRIPEDTRKAEKRQLIGIFPVVTTAANALYAQSMITVDDESVMDYESVISTIVSYQGWGLLSSDIVKQYSNSRPTSDGYERVYKDDGSLFNTVSREANTFFSSIQMNSQMTGFDTENLKKIGVVVYKAFLDASEGNKVNFNPVESFVGTLDKDAKNPNTGASTFIDTIVNTNSEYIYFFSNCFARDKTVIDQADLFIIKPGTTGMLGFFEDETKEDISLSSLYHGIDKCFENVTDINERDIDIIPDAGLANIAQYLKSAYGDGQPHAYDLDAVDGDGNPIIKAWKCDSKDCVDAWKTVLFKLDNFCKNVRKDCMFIADGPRPLVLQGQKKIIRTSKPSNTIDANILPYVKYVTGLNTNYGAGYMDWFQITDEFTGDTFWCPPSIKAMGVYINTDLNFEYWDVPAGLNRGVIAALDTAFSPTVKQAGSIYTKNWNYAINYPYDGIVLEGQKTFQVKPSAFDRVNVRRLFLRLERQTYKVARYFVYEGNTAYTRQRLIDMLDPIFYTAKVGGGIYDYKIICDESNNTATVIDNNELRVKIGIKPVKTAEFILIDFIALATGGSFDEM